jgi:DNA polymerase III delta subunit
MSDQEDSPQKSGNHEAENLFFNLELPQSINIKMVNADHFKDYETLSGVLTLLCSTFSTFGKELYHIIKEATGKKITDIIVTNKYLVALIAICLALIIITIIFICNKKKKMWSKKTKSILVKYTNDCVIEKEKIEKKCKLVACLKKKCANDH